GSFRSSATDLVLRTGTAGRPLAGLAPRRLPDPLSSFGKGRRHSAPLAGAWFRLAGRRLVPAVLLAFGLQAADLRDARVSAVLPRTRLLSCRQPLGQDALAPPCRHSPFPSPLPC